MRYAGKRALVTGGLGFIGSNLTIRLVEEGASVTVVDSRTPGCGANLFNISPVHARIRLVLKDIADPTAFRDALEASDVVFNLAGEISHIHSMQYPERDLQINTVAQLRFLIECAAASPGIRVVYASTRQIYGVPNRIPVGEDHPIQPVDFNGVHKYAASMYHQMLTRAGMIDAVVLRLTNVYGPRMALNVPCQGFLSTYLRRLVLGQDLEVFGDGTQVRDPVYVDDAIEAFLAAGAVSPVPSRSYNVGGPQSLSLAQIAETAASTNPAIRVVSRPFPAAIKPIDIGSFTSDSSRIAAELGWIPKVGFREGLERSLEYYRAHLDQYLDPNHPEPACDMPEHSGAKWRLTYAAV